jgi:multidrug resistance protein, MATE family
MQIPAQKTDHTGETLRLAWPLIITQLGHIVTGMVDNIFLGQIGPAEQAAGILSNNIYVLFLVFTIGISYATTPLVTGAAQTNDVLRKASLFKNSLFLNFIVAVICFVALFNLSGFLKYLQQPPEVIDMAVPFFDVIIFSMIPVSFFFTCKQYCEGLSNTRMALAISIIGNLINVILNYVLIYGKFGLPELGYLGPAWASFYARLFMGVAFLWLIFRSPATKEIGPVFNKVKIGLSELKELWKIGFNSAMQFTFEVAAFVVAGFMAGVFGKEQIDAHGIALSLAAFTYMFGSGIASAATIRVGNFAAVNDWRSIKAASFTAMKLVVIIMGGFAILFSLLNQYLPAAFSDKAEIIELAARLLIIAAMFQLFDGLQVTIIGILRGLEDVRIPTLITLVGYWLIAIPLAYVLAFTFRLETIGIWIALLTSLVCVAGGLFFRLRYLIRKNLL